MSALRQPTPPPETPPVAALPATRRDVLEAVRAAYTFVDARNEAEVFGVLEKRPDVAAVLLDALPHVDNVFGAGTGVLLLATNHLDGHPPTLSARINARGTIQEQLAKQDTFYRSWWLSISGEIDESLSFGV